MSDGIFCLPYVVMPTASCSLPCKSHSLACSLAWPPWLPRWLPFELRSRALLHADSQKLAPQGGLGHPHIIGSLSFFHFSISISFFFRIIFYHYASVQLWCFCFTFSLLFTFFHKFVFPSIYFNFPPLLIFLVSSQGNVCMSLSPHIDVMMSAKLLV